MLEDLAMKLCFFRILKTPTDCNVLMLLFARISHKKKILQ